MTKDHKRKKCGKKPHERYMKILKEDLLKDTQLFTSFSAHLLLPLQVTL